MLSAVIHSEHSYSAVPLAGQQIHQRFVHFGPLVLEANLLKNQRLQKIGDQPVSRLLPEITLCNGLEHVLKFSLENLRMLTFSLYGRTKL